MIVIRDAFAAVVVVGLSSYVWAAEFSASECLWYAQPAVVNDTQVPWAAGKSPSGNFGGGGQDQLGDASARYCAPNALAMKSRDPWESQTLPVGNGRVGGTVFGGDRRDRVNLNEV